MVKHTFGRAAEITMFALEWFFSCVSTHVPLHVRLDLEFGGAVHTGEWGIPGMFTQMNNQLTAGPTGIGTCLTSATVNLCQSATFMHVQLPWYFEIIHFTNFISFWRDSSNLSH